jgi:hypothetical protein
MSARTAVAPRQPQARRTPSAEPGNSPDPQTDRPTSALAQLLAASPRMAAQRRALGALQAPRPTTQLRPAVVQRELTVGDAEAFTKWLTEQPLKISDQQRLDIIRDSDSLEEAQQQAALDAEVGANIAAKREAYATSRGTMLEKAAIPKNAKLRSKFEQAALSIEPAIAELDDAQAHGGMGKGVASAVASLAPVLLETHPPQTCTYVLMGNSPAPLLAWLILNGYGQAACHLPLGGLTTPKGKAVTDKIGDGPLPAPIASYFDQSLATVLARRLPIVLIDYVSTGVSLVKTADYIERWLQGKGVALPVSFFGYSEHTLPEVPELAESPHGGVLATAEGPAEKVFTKLNADKVVKEVLLIRGPATLDVADLLEGRAPNAQPAHWKRVLRLMQAALLRED